MALFKCKMCGGALEINNNETVATCEYCDTQQTLPKLDDDRKVNLYDRANHFRRNNEYDKAMGIYEQILNEDNTDAEAYWSIILCRYGIEYVEDYVSHKRVPTVNRAQFTSVFDDDNYKSALKYADSIQRTVYEEEAKVINEIQKGILAISQKEEPFDVFICYKETDNNGRRTPDSVLANDLYHQLVQEGFKVFFSRITLEDKLGSAYEPYIFAALNSAKVMVVLGTRPEFFNAVWVKNEWSRYLSLIKQGQNKTLIPAYKDMDPYDLPEEFSHLQAQDMSKLGFMQDLIRGIKKITQVDESKITVVNENVVSGGNSNAAPLLKRAFMFLEDGEWERADEFCEQVLNLDPEIAEAYLGKLMAELKVKKREKLKDQAKPYDNNNNYIKALRFADDKLRKSLNDDIEFINDRNEKAEIARKDAIHAKGKDKMTAATTEKEYKEAADIFNSIKGYLDASELAKICYEKAKIARKDSIHTKGKDKMTVATTESEFKEVADIFYSIRGYLDSSELAKICYEKAEIARKDAIHAKGKDKMTAATTEKEYKEVADIFNSIRGYLDSSELAQICYEKAEMAQKDAILAKGKAKMTGLLVSNYEAAIKVFESIPGWKDADEMICACQKRIEEMKAKDEKARLEREHLEELRNKEKIRIARRNKIIAIMTVLGVCVLIAFIRNRTEKKENEKYNDAIALMDAGKLDEAYIMFQELGDYKDAEEKANNISLIRKKEQLREAKVGEYISFGTFEQDNIPSNGKEDIEWLVLEVKDGRIFVISRDALDYKKFNETLESTTWENCDLRKWLNDGFIKVAFSDDEKNLIPAVAVSADGNPSYTTNPGNVTNDQVFLLSITEVNKYFSSHHDLKCHPTDYAVAHRTRSEIWCSWWLRSPGEAMSRTVVITGNGVLIKEGYSVDNTSYAVRPAMWIDLN